MRSEAPPRQLAFLLVGAALLRLALGVLWNREPAQRRVCISG